LRHPSVEAKLEEQKSGANNGITGERSFLGLY
jgi:hypothetical protein